MKRRFVILLAIVALLSSCLQRNKRKQEAQDISLIKQLPREAADIRTVDACTAKAIDLDSIVESVQYIPLRGKKVYSVNKALFHKNAYYLWDRENDKLYKFSEDGRFLTAFSSKGTGPKNYERIDNFDIDRENDEIVLVDANGSKVMFFDLEGKYLRTSHNHSMQTFTSVHLSDSVFIRNFAQHHNADNKDMKHYSIGISSGDSLLYKAFPYYPVEMGPCAGCAFYKCEDGSVLFKPLFSDTTYYVTATSFRPAYHFKIPNSAWERYKNSKSPVNLLNKREIIKPWIYESEHYLWALLQMKFPEHGNQTSCGLLYHRGKDESYLLFPKYKSCPDVMEGVCDGAFSGVKSSDTFIMSITAKDLRINDSISIPAKVKAGEIKVPDPSLKKALLEMADNKNTVLQ